MHQPVLLKEVLEYLEPKSGENFIDCTIGLAGHGLILLEKNKPSGKVLGIEWDEQTSNILKQRKSDSRLILVQGNYADLKEIAKQNNFESIKGILFDLGMSSWQIEKSGRGFSFQKDEILDMRYHPEGITAQEIVNQWPQEELIRIFREYGEERYAQRIARLICQKRQRQSIKTTNQLVEIIVQAAPRTYQRRKINPATQVFQALRIAVNDELNNLNKALPQASEILEKDGRIVVISFHSLEDRIVKHFFRQAAREKKLKILTKKPIRPSQEEIKFNPRSRSAKLRAAQKI
ncbi:MAG: 16S rRNA (cytosine(1402)-N(4))-methyltransferase RsmH [Patescibacteria group bacterium]